MPSQDMTAPVPINQLIKDRFSVFNVDREKRPVNKTGLGVANWQRMSYDELCAIHNLDSLMWGIRLGEHENGRKIMSLDFDCCGAPILIKSCEDGPAKKQRMGCPKTTERKETYLKGAPEDGVYTSSTEGNMNVLIDYTKSPKICALVKTLGKTKMNLASLEVLFSGNQVIPPTATKSKITAKLGPPRKFKNGKCFVEIVDDDFVCKYVEELFAEIAAPAVASPAKKAKGQEAPSPPPTNLTTLREGLAEVPQVVDKWLDLLTNVIRNEKVGGVKVITHAQWFQICGILKTNEYPKEVWLDYSRQISQTNTASKTWNAVNVVATPMSIYGLINIAKKVNLEGYNAWANKHNQFIPLETLERGENDVAQFMKPRLAPIMVFSQNKWFIFEEPTGLWRQIKNPAAIAISHTQRLIDESRGILLIRKSKETDEAALKKLTDIDGAYHFQYTRLTTAAYSSQLIKLLGYHLYDGNFLARLDNSQYRICYKNGVLDLRTLQFQRGIQAHDYMSKPIPFDWEPAAQADQDAVERELLKICNNNRKHLDYYLSFLGYAMTGDSDKMQKFWVLRGQKACNGKSVVFDALTKMAPNYVMKLESNILEREYGSRHKEQATWRGARLAWVNELSKKKQDETILKEIADGISMRYKVMYGEMDTMPITFKLAIVTNNTVQFDDDEGVKRRITYMQMDSEFVEGLAEDDYAACRFKKDFGFGELLQTKYKHALLALIFQYSQRFAESKVLEEYPPEWAEETKASVTDNNKFADFFYDHFEVAEGASVSKADFERCLQDFKGHIIVKDELKKLRFSWRYASQERRTGATAIRGYYYGFRLIPADPMFEDNDGVVEEA